MYPLGDHIIGHPLLHLLANLLAARELTRVELAAARARLNPLTRDPDVAVVLFGSWGRHELTPNLNFG